MRIFMIEWYDKYTHRYMQEYYLHIVVAAARYNALEKQYQEANPDMSTIWVNTEEELI